jgi:hypothetical protein
LSADIETAYKLVYRQGLVNTDKVIVRKGNYCYVDTTQNITVQIT